MWKNTNGSKNKTKQKKNDKATESFEWTNDEVHLHKDALEYTQVFICILKIKISICTDGAVDSGAVQHATKSGASARGCNNKTKRNSITNTLSKKKLQTTA